MRRSVAALSALLASVGAVAAQTGAIEGTVHGTNRRAAGAVVYLVAGAGERGSWARDPAVMDQVNLSFVPDVVVVLPGTAVEFRNSDAFLHNVFSPAGAAIAFDLGRYPRTESRSHTFAELGPHVILCHVHPEMAAFVFVAPTPYHAVVDQSGRFRIDNVPPGRYTLRVWHRRTKSAERAVEVTAGDTLRVAVEVVLGRDRARDGGTQGWAP